MSFRARQAGTESAATGGHARGDRGRPTAEEPEEKSLLADAAEATATPVAGDGARPHPAPSPRRTWSRFAIRSGASSRRRAATRGSTPRRKRELGRAARERGDLDAARRLVVHNLRLVVAIAYQYRQAWLNVLDLFQEGSVGLMEAVRRWDPEVGTRFGSYAAYWIRAYVLRFLMTNARLIHVGNTRAGRKLFFRLERERQKLLAAGFDPTPKLLAAKLDVDEADLVEVSGHLASREISLRAAARRRRRLRSPSASRGTKPRPRTRPRAASCPVAVRRLMDEFEKRPRRRARAAIWREHLATSASEPVSLATLGERYGVTKQRMGRSPRS